jgi:hypothetical protein
LGRAWGSHWEAVGRGKRRGRELAEGESVGVVRVSGIEIFVFVYALLFASSPRSVPPYYSYLEIPPANDVLHLN